MKKAKQIEQLNDALGRMQDKDLLYEAGLVSEVIEEIKDRQIIRTGTIYLLLLIAIVYGLYQLIA